MTSIRLSVAMANFNHAHFLATRIPSILEQLGPNDEFVIVDDGSTDHSVALIESYAHADGRIRLIRHLKNRGVIEAANRSFQESRGKYLVSLSADDRILPGFIDKTMKVLENHPDIALCCSNCALWYDGFPDKDPSQIYTTPLIPGIEKPTVFLPSQITRVFSKTPFWIPGHTSIIKRDLLHKYGGMDAGLGYLCDWFLIHSIAFFHGAAYIPEDLSVWRQDIDSYSKQASPDYVSRIEMRIFGLLCEKERKSLRKKFRKSGLLRLYVRKRFFQLCVFPRYWDFILFFLIRGVKNRCKRLFTKRTKI
ncbi:MAG: glycosyltransferase family 2 protein [Simkania sp.]|nr:glycosyltransferase family 2 protein [Simkania sp.]